MDKKKKQTEYFFNDDKKLQSQKEWKISEQQHLIAQWLVDTIVRITTRNNIMHSLFVTMFEEQLQLPAMPTK